MFHENVFVKGKLYNVQRDVYSRDVLTTTVSEQPKGDRRLNSKAEEAGEGKGKSTLLRKSQYENLVRGCVC